jgi:hypothetical protein
VVVDPDVPTATGGFSSSNPGATIYDIGAY